MCVELKKSVLQVWTLCPPVIITGQTVGQDIIGFDPTPDLISGKLDDGWELTFTETSYIRDPARNQRRSLSPRIRGDEGARWGCPGSIERVPAIALGFFVFRHLFYKYFRRVDRLS